MLKNVNGRLDRDVSLQQVRASYLPFGLHCNAQMSNMMPQGVVKSGKS